MESDKVSILIADDDLDDHNFIREALISLSHCELFFFQDGEELLIYLETKEARVAPPKLIILDLNMPNVNGFECLKLIKTLDLYTQVPVICFTTSSSKEDRDECEKLGAVEFITKPRSFEKFKQVLLTSVQRWLSIQRSEG